MTAEELGLLEACRQSPEDRAPMKIYHDWLLDHGRGQDAQVVQSLIDHPGIKNLEDLKGMILTKVEGDEGDDEMIFTTITGERVKFYSPDGSSGNDANVSVDNINGDLQDLVGVPILVAEEVSDGDDGPDLGDVNYTWTFLRFATRKGTVVVRWYGTSNGWYAESPSMEVT